MAGDAPFFIVGSGRSGTTLLRLILTGHSRLHIPPETWFIQTLVQELPLSEPLTPAQVEYAVGIITGNYRWPDMELAAEDLRASAQALASPRLADVINLVYRTLCARAGKPRFGDKTPAYISIVPQLVTLYPDARFIHLIRDGRDVAMSWIDLKYERYYETKGFEWVTVMRHRAKLLRGPLAGRVLEVKYEDLVIDPKPTVQRICSFLGERFEPDMLRLDGKAALVPPRERHIHRGLNRPVSSDGVAAWRRRLTAAECFAMESVLHHDLRALGYPLRFSAAAWRPLLDVTGCLLRLGAPLLGKAIPALQRRGLLPARMYI